MKKIIKIVGSIILSTILMIVNIMPTYAGGIDYSKPVERIPEPAKPITNFSMNLCTVDSQGINHEVDNNLIEIDGKPIEIDMYLTADDKYNAVLFPGESYSVEVIGDNVKKEKINSGAYKTIDVTNYSQLYNEENQEVMFCFLMPFRKLTRRLGVNLNNIHFLTYFSTLLHSEYTLDTLRKYSCAREFVDKENFMCTDEPF